MHIRCSTAKNNMISSTLLLTPYKSSPVKKLVLWLFLKSEYKQIPEKKWFVTGDSQPSCEFISTSPTKIISLHNQASTAWLAILRLKDVPQLCTHPQNHCLKTWSGISLTCNSGCGCVVTNTRKNCKLQADSNITSFLLVGLVW